MKTKDEDIELIRDTYNKAYDKGKQAGMKEVVDWIENRNYHKDGKNYPTGFYQFEGLEWQAKLNEWDYDRTKESIPSNGKVWRP